MGENILQHNDIEFDELFKTVINAIPSPVFIVDDDVKILAYNLTASRMLSSPPETIIKRRGGDLLHCIHSTESLQGCGRAEFCKDCVIRNSVNKAFQCSGVTREKTKMELRLKDKIKKIFLLVTTSPFEYKKQKFALLILEDIGELIELKSVLPICSKCKKIRNDNEYWQEVEEYFEKYMDLSFTHGYCPECKKDILEEHSHLIEVP